MKRFVFALVAASSLSALSCLPTTPAPPAPALQMVFEPPVSPWQSLGNFGKAMEMGQHLGEDCDLPVDTAIHVIGDGTVTHAQYHCPTPQKPHNWGGLVIVTHVLPNGQRIHSLYGHILLYPNIVAGKKLYRGDILGSIAPKSPSNGNWDPHLHLQVVVDPTNAYREGAVLAGYYTPTATAPNRLIDCVSPSSLFKLNAP